MTSALGAAPRDPARTETGEIVSCDTCISGSSGNCARNRRTTCCGLHPLLKVSLHPIAQPDVHRQSWPVSGRRASRSARDRATWPRYAPNGSDGAVAVDLPTDRGRRSTQRLGDRPTTVPRGESDRDSPSRSASDNRQPLGWVNAMAGMPPPCESQAWPLLIDTPASRAASAQLNPRRTSRQNSAPAHEQPADAQTQSTQHLRTRALHSTAGAARALPRVRGRRVPFNARCKGNFYAARARCHERLWTMSEFEAATAAVQAALDAGASYADARVSCTDAPSRWMPETGRSRN